MQEMRQTILQKFDAISAHILEYIEEYIKYTPEEMEEMKYKNVGGRKIDSNIK